MEDGETYLNTKIANQTRWSAAQYNIHRTRAITVDWHVLVITLHEIGKKACRRSELVAASADLYLSTPLCSFVGVQYSREFKTGRTTERHVGTIYKVTEVDGTDDLLHPGLHGKYLDGHVETLTKAQLIDLLEAPNVSGTANFSSELYELYLEISEASFLLMSAWQMDVARATKRLSEMIQRDSVLPSEIRTKLRALHGELDHFAAEKTPAEAAICAEYDDQRQLWRGIAVPNFTTGLRKSTAAKRDYIKHFKEELGRLFEEDEDVVALVELLMDTTSWPMEDREKMTEFGVQEMKKLVTHFAPILPVGDSHIAGKAASLLLAVESEWRYLKCYIMEQKLQNEPLHIRFRKLRD
jgi:hypothetical protein